MINEREIAKGFSAVWSQIFPMLTPNFMKEFNESRVIKFKDNLKIQPTRHSDVIAELSFNISKMCFEKGISMEAIRQNRELIEQALKTSLRSIRNSSKIVDLPNQLDEAEIDEAILIASNINSFIDSWQSKSLLFAPKLQGYGIVSECYADMSIDDTLFEIKTVTRPFRSKDLKQLFLYLALQSVTDGIKWKNAGLYNPRLGHYCKFNVENVIRNLSGSESSAQAFGDLLELFIRDVEIEKRF